MRRRFSSFEKADFRASVAITEAILKEGWLQKKTKGLTARYVKRYFTVDSHYLKYYEDDTKQEKGVKGLLYLPGVTVTQNGAEIVVQCETREATVKADSEETANNWVSAIKSARDEARIDRWLESIQLENPFVVAKSLEEKGITQIRHVKNIGHTMLSALELSGEEFKRFKEALASLSEDDSAMMTDQANPMQSNPMYRPSVSKRPTGGNGKAAAPSPKTASPSSPASAPTPEAAAAIVAASAPRSSGIARTSSTGGLFSQRDRSFSLQTEIPDIANDTDTSYDYGSQHRMKFGESYFPSVSVTRPGNNVAANKAADCDNEDVGYMAGFAVDENRSTYWCSKEDTNEAVFTVDLRSVMTVFKMRIRWKFHAQVYTVSVSNNRKHFHKIYEEKEGAGKEMVPIPTFTARFVRIEMSEAGKKFQGKPILGIIDVMLVSGVYVTILEGSLKGKEYYVEKPHRTLVSLEDSEADYKRSIQLAAELAAEKHTPTKQKVKDRFQPGSHWKLTNYKQLPDTSAPAVTVVRQGDSGSVYVQRMIGKCEEILVEKPLKVLKPLPKKAQSAATELRGGN